MSVPVSGSFAYQDHPEIARRFPELHPPFDCNEALSEANRCLNCFNAPCAAACPTHIDVPRFIKKITSGNLTGSAIAILEANILGSSCSRVCPVEVLCEGACVLLAYNKQPIAIGRLQRYAMDDFFERGESLPMKSQHGRPRKIVCIGAGPASLACSAELAQRGFPVTVLERRALPGGLNTYGVAEYKLRPPDSLREIAMIAALGVEFQFGVGVDAEADLARLEQQYDAIFVGIGLGNMHALRIPGADHPDVIDALDFIARYKTAGRLRVGRRVVVIGAGNTAIDAANAARRLGAEHVTIVYRKTVTDMPAFGFEYEHAKQEGVVFEWLAQPVSIHTDPTSGAIVSLECLRQDAQFQLPCDMVIPAIGQTSHAWLMERARGPKYFAGGDCVNGGREVVDAVADGKRAAIAIARSFEGGDA